MNMIESAVWNEYGTVIVVTMSDGTVLDVPDDMSNRHRVELEEWIAAGNMMQPYMPPPTAKQKKHK